MNTNNAMAPRNGTKPISRSQPLKLPSCRRRTDSASDGTIVAKPQMTSRMVPKVAPGPGAAVVLKFEAVVVAAAPAPTMRFKMTPTPTETSVHHQYSLRLARPEKVAYFLKNRLMATGKGAP